jgi:hypothetical protein
MGPLLVIGCLATLGFLLARVILGSPRWMVTLSLSLPLGGGVFTWLMFVTSRAGVELNRASVLLLWMVAVIGLSVWLWIGQPARLVQVAERSSPKPSRVARPGRTRKLADLILVGGLALILPVSVYLAVGRSYSSYDATAGWAVKGYGIVLEGTVDAAERWGMWGRAYPLNMPLQIGIFQLFTGDLLPGSMLLFPLTYLSGLLGFVRFLRQRISDLLASLAVLFLATNPLIFLHSSIGYANLPFAVYLVLGYLWSVEGVTEDQPRLRLLGGILLALSSWTRPEGIVYCLAVALALATAHWLTRQGSLGRGLWLLPIGLVFGSWYAFSRSGLPVSNLGSAVREFLVGVLQGDLHLLHLKQIPSLYFSRGIHPSNLGFFFPIVVLLLALGVRSWRSHRAPVVIFLLLGALAISAMPVLLFYVQSYSLTVDYRELLIRSFDRATIPGIFSMAIAASVLAGYAFNPRRDLYRAAAGDPVS